MYKIYVDGMLFPVAPPSMETKINGRNETIDLASGHQINMLKEAGLTDISMDLRLPNTEVPYAQYEDGFQSAQVYLDQLEKCKKLKKQEGFDLTIIREFDGLGTVQTDKIDNAVEDAMNSVDFVKILHEEMANYPGDPHDAVYAAKKRYQTEKNTAGAKAEEKAVDNYSIQVSLEDYTLKEDAEEGYDWIVECEFKEWRDFGTKTIKLKTSSKSNKITKISKGKKRKRKKKVKASTKIKATKKKGKTYTTNLWTLCKGAYGHGDTWSNIVLQDKRNVASLKAAAKKLKIKWTGLTTAWRTKSLPAGTKIYFPKTTWSPKTSKSKTKKK